MPNYNLDDYLAVTHKLSSAQRDIYGIPFIEKQDFPFEKIATDYTLVKYNNCTEKTKLLEHKIAHGFAYDSELVRVSQSQLDSLVESENAKRGSRQIQALIWRPLQPRR